MLSDFVRKERQEFGEQNVMWPTSDATFFSRTREPPNDWRKNASVVAFNLNLEPPSSSVPEQRVEEKKDDKKRTAPQLQRALSQQQQLSTKFQMEIG